MPRGWRVSCSGESRATGLGCLAERLADDADDGQQHGSAHAASRHARHDRGDVEATAPAGHAEHAEKLAAEAAAQDANNGITGGAETEVLERRARDVAADGTAG